MEPGREPRLREPNDADFVLHVWRYGRLEEIECDTLAEAESIADYCCNDAEGWPVCITHGAQILRTYSTEPPCGRPIGQPEDTP
jgi:hypothetical protein